MMMEGWRDAVSRYKPIKVMIVDDNAHYREALKRALGLNDYDVCEAGDADDAAEVLRKESPDIVVTDLQMRTQREGLDLIETIKASDPLLPVIMISGVGSFEEGALATQLGEANVIHKSRIEDEMDGFFSTIRKSCRQSQKSRKHLDLIRSAKQEGEVEEDGDKVKAVRRLLVDPDVDPYVKGEAYDFIAAISERELLRQTEADMRYAAESGRHEEICDISLRSLQERLACFGVLKEESRQALTTAEYLYHAQGESEILNFSRTIAFSYCFAVEHEVRAKLKGRISRLASNPANQRILEACVDRKSRQVDMYFQQSILLATRNKGIHFTMENVQQVLLRMISRGGKFKAEGLKDVGIILLCFARKYNFSKWGQKIEVSDLLNLKGLKDEQELVDLAGNLISLQYARNPYVHPETKKKEQLSMLRATAFECLDGVGRLV